MIKERLLQLVPSIRIFLDVDDLDAVDKLAEYIAASDSILCFISGTSYYLLLTTGYLLLATYY